MEREEIELQAARCAFGHLETWEMQEFIDGLLNNGIYADEFLDVVEPEATTREIVGIAFAKALKALGVTVPTYEEAVWVILRYHISRIARREADALDGLEALMGEVYWSYDFRSKTYKYLGDSHGIERFIGLYWGYDDLRERPTEISLNGKYGEEAIEELKKEITAEAEMWMKRYGTKSK